MGCAPFLFSFSAGVLGGGGGLKDADGIDLVVADGGQTLAQTQHLTRGKGLWLRMAKNGGGMRTKTDTEQQQHRKQHRKVIVVGFSLTTSSSKAGERNAERMQSTPLRPNNILPG